MGRRVVLPTNLLSVRPRRARAGDQSMKLSLRERAHKYLKARPKKWINGGEMERLAMDAGYKGSTISRELRRLAEESYDKELDLGGFVLRDEKPGERTRSVWYAWVAERDKKVERFQMLQENAAYVKEQFPD